MSLLSEPPRVTEAQAFGAGAFGEAIDFANAALGIGTREEQRDLTSATGATAAATATAHLRQRALDAAAGEIVVPPNCGQELLDAIDFTDALISRRPRSSAASRRSAGATTAAKRSTNRPSASARCDRSATHTYRTRATRLCAPVPAPPPDPPPSDPLTPLTR